MNYHINGLLAALDSGGLGAGLTYLNSRTPHRFTAVYKLVNDVFKLHHLVSKHVAPEVDIPGDIPYDDSYCQYSIGMGEFVTEDSANDSRLNGHKFQGVVASYVGLPLVGYPDGLIGTFCHYDVEPRPQIPDEEFQYLQRAVRLLPKYLDRPVVVNIQ